MKKLLVFAMVLGLMAQVSDVHSSAQQSKELDQELLEAVSGGGGIIKSGYEPEDEILEKITTKVRALLEAGANVNAVASRDHRTVLIKAILANRYAVVDLF